MIKNHLHKNLCKSPYLCKSVFLSVCISVIIIGGLLFPIFQVFATSATTSINLQVQTGISPLCNQNGICESGIGETESNCFTDCGCNNNGICESARLENYENCPLDCPVRGTVFIPDTSPPVIYNLLISKITLNSAEISWATNDLALCQFFLGENEEYEKEVISETTFYLEHSTKLLNLSPETAYHFKISCRDTNKNESETKDQKFFTLTPPDITPPANVSDFEAIPGDGQIILKWQNPPDPDFQGVKIMRSTDFYPSNPSDGILVYDGKETSVDVKHLQNGVRYYFTVFAYDYAGNYSSGAIVSATPFKIKPPPPPPPEEIPTEEECVEPGYYWYDETCHPEPRIPPPPPEIEKLKLEDFDFWQKGAKLLLSEENRIKLEEKEPLTISIDYEKVPEVLKTMMVTLEQKEKFFSFLLRVNKEKTRYEAIILPPEPGIYTFLLDILDYKNQTLKKIPGQLEVTETRPLPVEIPWYEKYRLYLFLFLILLILLASGIIYFFRKKRKEAS